MRKRKVKAKPQRTNYRAEADRLRLELEEAKETLRAIQSGEVDALVVSGPKGERIFTLKSADHPYRILVETMSEGAVTLDGQGGIFYCNRRFSEMLGLPHVEVTGFPFSRFIREEDREVFQTAFVEIRNGRSRCTLQLLGASGSRVPVLLSMSGVDLEDKDGVCVIATDLTEQKKLEEAKLDVERLNLEQQLRESFVSTLSHDLRNPLSAAITAAQLLGRFPGKIDKVASFSNRIVQSIRRADQMIQNLLDANRIHAGQKLPLEIDECDLIETAKMTLEELSMTLGDRFVLSAPPRVQGYWSCEQIRRVIENLASNAVKYGSPHAPVQIKLKEKGTEVLLAVHNEGAGIPKSEQAYIFKPFRRTDSAQSSRHQGWGLGLTLVRGVAEAHGGRVEVRSAPGKGTTFTVVLPKDSRPFQTANQPSFP